ncbi:MAG: hypothetical protein WA902_04275, partial [Thermosynechococcaceae cyanobacterium]
MTLNLTSLRKTLIYSRSGVAKELIADLNLMAQSDAIAEQTLARLGTLQIITIIGLIGAFLVGIFAELPLAFWTAGILLIV